MVIETLIKSLDLYRPTLPQTHSPVAEVAYTKAVLSKVKLGQNTVGWQLGTTGATQVMGATIFFNHGVSAESPRLEPVFKEGDIICEHSETATAPSAKKFVVKAVHEHTFKGYFHHYEVELS